MPKSLSTEYTYLTGTARFHDMIYVGLHEKSLADRDLAHCRMFALDNNEWFLVSDRNWTVIGMTMANAPSQKMIAASEDGEAVACVGGEEFDEHIGTDVCVLRGLGCIAGEAYACGMKRQVYRRVGEDQWVAMHAPAPDRPGDA
ncbi:MAG: hypothetical protein ACFB22_11020, partial [Rhodothalassiaceae bacterium]